MVKSAFNCSFTKIQTAIHQNANQMYMVTLMRRQMYKIASYLCERDNYDVIINGESIGQCITNLKAFELLMK